jgi:hypothetical protein
MYAAIRLYNRLAAYISPFSIVLLAVVTDISIAADCPLSRKQISIDITTCPSGQQQIDSNCRRGRMRFVGVGSKILESTNEIEDSGLEYELNKKMDVPRAKLGREIQGTYLLGNTGASYSFNELRLKYVRSRYIVESKSLLQENIFNYIIFVSPNCQACEVKFYRSTSNIYPPGRAAISESDELATQACEIRAYE